MSIFNGQWLAVSHIDSSGYSYIQLQDIDRVSLTCQKSDGGETHQVTMFSQGKEYSYTKKNTLGEAENAATEVLRLIETALGRLGNPSAA